jgi:hypothetical protein
MFAGRVGTGFSEKLLANLYGKLQTKTIGLPLYQPAGEITRALGSGDYPGDHETLPVD